LKTLSSKMWNCTLFGLFLWTLLSLVAAIPDEISSIENEIEQYVPDNSNNTNGSVIPQPRFVQVNVNYKTYTIFFEEVNWFTALERCGNNGKKLASITSLDDSIKLIETLDTLSQLYATNFWLGASDLGHNGQYVWASNGEAISRFTNWRAGEPNNWCGHEHCLELLSDGQWNDLNCDYKLKFICESLPPRSSYDVPIYG
ncbi:hypothetical protein DOY81_005153, partial [Sarcophaga bullata]